MPNIWQVVWSHLFLQYVYCLLVMVLEWEEAFFWPLAFSMQLCSDTQRGMRHQTQTRGWPKFSLRLKDLRFSHRGRSLTYICIDGAGTVQYSAAVLYGVFGHKNWNVTSAVSPKNKEIAYLSSLIFQIRNTNNIFYIFCWKTAIPSYTPYKNKYCR